MRYRALAIPRGIVGGLLLGWASVLAALPAQQAEMLLLRSDGFQYDELGRTMSINPASVGTLLSRAREAFRKEYVKRYGDQ